MPVNRKAVRNAIATPTGWNQDPLACVYFTGTFALFRIRVTLNQNRHFPMFRKAIIRKRKLRFNSVYSETTANPKYLAFFRFGCRFFAIWPSFFRSKAAQLSTAVLRAAPPGRYRGHAGCAAWPHEARRLAYTTVGVLDLIADDFPIQA